MDYIGAIDKWFQIPKIRKAVERIDNGGGYPNSWIYNDQKDAEDFEALLRLAKKYSHNKAIVKRIRQGESPSLIIPAGEPDLIKGVPDSWPQEERYFYSDNHPVLLFFNFNRFDAQKGIGPEFSEKIGSIGDLRHWIEEKKFRIRYWLGVVVVCLISISLILFRLSLQKKN